jgi:drug/metabolite transporter (DMT)-like permease
MPRPTGERTQVPEREPPSTRRVIAAFAAIYLVWGSTYLAIRVAIESLPPLTMAGARFVLAGGALYAWMRLRGEPAPDRRQWAAAAAIGALLFLMGNGGVVLAERTIPSGAVALLVAMVPFWMVLVDWARPGGRRPTGRTGIGLVVGFAGIVMLVGAPLGAGERLDPFGVAVVAIGSFCWAVGSIHMRSAPLPPSRMVATGMQMLCGGIWLAAAGLAVGEVAALDPAAITARSVAAWAYLVVLGSLVGFTAYVWLLAVTTPARVSTYAYVNPVVAVLLGWGVAGEPLTLRVLVSAAVIVSAVATITLADPRRPAGRPVRVGGPPAA